MKYIRTKTTIYLMTGKTEKCYFVKCKTKSTERLLSKKEVIKQADNIKKLCDRFIVYVEDKNLSNLYDYYDEAFDYYEDMCFLEYTCKLFGVIETDKGLIYKAKMNDKGDLELI